MAVEEVGIRLNLQQRRQTTSGLREVRGELAGVADAGQDVETAGRDAAKGLEKASDRKFVRGFEAIARGGAGIVTTLGRGVLGAAKATAVGLGVVTTAATGLGIASIGLAGDARETASAFDTVFGPSARGVQKDLDGLTKRFGLYNPELQDAARQFGVFGKAAGVARKDLPNFSTDLTKAGLDLSSFYNVDPGTAFAALQSGLSGESEPLRQFGIFLSDASLNAYAAAQGIGKTTKEMSDQEKVALRQAFVLANLGDAQGDLARTSKGFANQQRSAGGQVKSFMTMLGGPLTTAATGAFKGFNSIAKVGIKMLSDQLPGLEQRAGGVSRFLSRWGRQLGKELPNSISIAVAWWDRVTERVGGFTTKAKGVDVTALKGQLTGFRGPLRDIGDALSGIDLGALGSSAVQGASDTLSVFSVVIGFAADHVDTLAKYLPLLIVGFAAYKTAQAAANVVALADIPIKFAQIGVNIALARSNNALAFQLGAVTGAERAGMITRARGTVVTIASTVASKAAALATKVWTIATKALGLAMRLTPLGMVITGITLLAAGFVLLYKKSDTFRGLVNGLWNNVLKPFGSFVGKVLVGYFKLLATAWLTMGRVGLKAFSWLLWAAFMTFDGILSAAEKGLGWVPGLGDKIRGAREKFNDFGNATISKLDELGGKLKATQDKINGIAQDRAATITITTVTNARAAESSLNGGKGSGGGGTKATTPVQAPHTTSRAVTAGAPLMAPDLDLGAAAADAASTYAVAGAAAGPGQPLIIQNVMDGKVTGEATVGYIQGRLARQ